MESIKKESMNAQKSIMEITGILFKAKLTQQQMELADTVTDDISKSLNVMVEESQKSMRE